MLLQFSAAAEDDLEAIADYIAEDSPANAIRFIDQMRVQCLRLVKAPIAYMARPELGEGLRSCAHGRYVGLLSAEPNGGADRAHPSRCARFVGTVRATGGRVAPHHSPEYCGSSAPFDNRWRDLGFGH